MSIAVIAAALTLAGAVQEKVLPFGTQQVASAVFAFNALDEMDVRADSSWRALASRADYEAYRLGMREKMLAACGTFPERTPLNARTVETLKRNGYTIEKVIFESMPGILVTGNLFIPDGSGKRPTLVMSCGHASEGKDCDTYLRACVNAVTRGFVTFMFDPYQQGERRWKSITHSSTTFHTQMGLRAQLLDWSAPLLRIWDGMRAIDYVATRPEVDMARLGYMGQSGGGTMTALMEAAEPRIRAAAPSCYLTSLSALCHNMGPQDGEQNIFGQLAFGLNHTGYVLIPDIPVAVTCKMSDMFSYYGTKSLYRTVQAVGARLGFADRYMLNDAPGPHGWTEATEVSSVLFLAKNLIAGHEKDVIDLQETRLKDIGFSYRNVDLGLATNEIGCTSACTTEGLADSRGIFDVIREKAEAALASRGKPSADAAKWYVQKFVKVRRPTETGIRFKEYGQKTVGETVMIKVVGQYPDGRFVPAIRLVRPSVYVGGKNPVVIAAHAGRAKALAAAEPLLAAGRAVVLVDVAGCGEVGTAKHVFYGRRERTDEGLAAMLYLMGDTLIAWQATDLLAIAAHVGGTADLIADGPVCIAAAHAAAFQRDAWGAVTLKNRPKSWEETLKADPNEIFYYADLVPGAFLKYDWVDLVR